MALQAPDLLPYGLICTNSTHVQPLQLSKDFQKDLLTTSCRVRRIESLIRDFGLRGLSWCPHKPVPRSTKSGAHPSIDELVHQTFQALIAQVPDIYTYQTQHFCNTFLLLSSKAFLGEMASSQEHPRSEGPQIRSNSSSSSDILSALRIQPQISSLNQRAPPFLLTAPCRFSRGYFTAGLCAI